MSLFDLLRGWLVLVIPMVVAGALHMVAVKQRWISLLAIPLAERWFGGNKTWRGVLLMPLFAVLGGLISYAFGLFDGALSHYVYGCAAAGLGYILAELPNSFIKRRLNIAPGSLPQRRRVLFLGADQLDSAIGSAIGYAVVLRPPLAVLILYLLLFLPAALGVKHILYSLRLKQTRG